MTSVINQNKSANRHLATSYVRGHAELLDDAWKHTAKFHWTNIAIKGIGGESRRWNSLFDEENILTFPEFVFSGNSHVIDELDGWFLPNLDEDEPDDP